MKFQNVILNVSVLACLLSSVGAASLFALNVNEKLNADFLTGFESGLFLRNSSSSQFKEYNCPEQHIDSKEFKTFSAALTPIKLIS